MQPPEHPSSLITHPRLTVSISSYIAQSIREFGLILALIAMCLEACASARKDPWLSVDKAMHCSVSASVAAGLYMSTRGTLGNEGERVLFSAGVTLGLGVGKEVLDLAGVGTPSWRDMVWNVIGTLLGVGVGVGLDQLTRPAGP